jgi:glucan phosphoethanolaminetransferase (alkaline phosphatase superfamily)
VIIILPIFIAVCIVAWMLRPKKGMPVSRKYAIFAVSFSALALAITAIIFQLLQNATGNIEVANISNTLFSAGLLLICAAILVLVGFAVTRRAEIAKGIGFGICIAVIVSIFELGILEWISGV